MDERGERETSLAYLNEGEDEDERGERAGEWRGGGEGQREVENTRNQARGGDKAKPDKGMGVGEQEDQEGE